MKIPRRDFVKNIAGGIGVFSLQGVSQQPSRSSTKLKIVCVGGHPDDPESGCGGTLAKLAAAGHQITVIYLTRGEAGIPGKSHAAAAEIRTKEAKAACSILNAQPVFAGQTDGDSLVNNEWITKLHDLLDAAQPDIVFTHWPVDKHKDHQAASLLTMQVYFRMQRAFALYFFEVCTGEQTTLFRPTDYVDITDVQEQKRQAVYCHVSQNPPGIYNCGHAAMEEFRGRETGVKAAEAFVQMTGVMSWI